MRLLLLSALLAISGLTWAQPLPALSNPPAHIVANAEEDVDFTVAGQEGFTYYCTITGEKEIELAVSFNDRYWGPIPPEGPIDCILPEVVNGYTVTSIGKFRNDPYHSYNKLRVDLTIPNTVKTIGDGAFGGWENLESVKIPGSVETLGMGAFGNCRYLSSVELSEGLKVIGTRTFAESGSLVTILLPETIEEIEEGAFSYTKLQAIELPKSIKSIGASAFEHTNIESVILPESLRYIGPSAFQTVKKVEMPSLEWWFNLERDGSIFWFYNAHVAIYINGEQITEITIPDGIQEIGEDTFTSWQIDGISIPESVTSIGRYAFSYSGIKSIEVPSSVKILGEKCFEDCRDLSKVTLPENILSFGNEMFRDCSSLVEVNLPEGIDLLGEHTFSDCGALRKVNLPATLTEIAGEVFNKCYSLREIISRAITPPNFMGSFDDTFHGVNTACTVKVPAESVDAYKEHSIWGVFWNIEPLDDEPGSGVDEISASVPSDSIRIYTMQGVEVYNGNEEELDLPSGIYIVLDKDGSRKKVIRK